MIRSVLVALLIGLVAACSERSNDPRCSKQAETDLLGFVTSFRKQIESEGYAAAHLNAKGKIDELGVVHDVLYECSVQGSSGSREVARLLARLKLLTLQLEDDVMLESDLKYLVLTAEVHLDEIEQLLTVLANP